MNYIQLIFSKLKSSLIYTNALIFWLIAGFFLSAQLVADIYKKNVSLSDLSLFILIAIAFTYGYTHWKKLNLQKPTEIAEYSLFSRQWFAIDFLILLSLMGIYYFILFLIFRGEYSFTSEVVVNDSLEIPEYAMIPIEIVALAQSLTEIETINNNYHKLLTNISKISFIIGTLAIIYYFGSL